MAKTGRAIIYREPDNEYTVVIFSKAAVASEDSLDSATSNLTLANAFNKARDDLAAMATGSEKHQLITISTRIA